MRDIKSAKMPSGMDVSCLLKLPMSTFFKIIASEKVKKVTVVIEKPTPHSTIAPTPKKSFNNFLMLKSRPIYTDFTSKFEVKTVENFQRGYWEAPNKGDYHSKCTEKKPSIDAQIESFIVFFLNKHRVQYKDGTGREDKRAQEGLSKLVKTALFVNNRRATLGRSHVSKYLSSDILESIKHSIQAKACQSKLVSLTKEEVGK